MEYQIKTIENKEQITECNLFEIQHYRWCQGPEPKTYGWAGYLPGTGFFIKMVCEEEDPKRIYQNHRDPVYRDSAMEVFMAFPHDGEELSNDVMYINFEMNANGALYAAYGKGRNGRQFISGEMYERSHCRAKIKEGKWELEVTIPEEFLREISDFASVKAGATFYCNFYKISESKEIEHYGSFSPIESEKPNFHLPVCFAETKISK